MSMVKTNIDEAIARVDDWKGCKISYDPVPGGITNPNFKVNVDGVNFFLKIPGEGTDFIDRPNCHAANLIADKSGAGPKVYYYFDDTGVEIFEWLEGYRTLNFGDMYDGEIFKEIFTHIAAFHNVEGMTLPLTQSVFKQAYDMIDRVKDSNYLPPWHDKMLYMLKVCEEAFQKYGAPNKPCHNDFWTNNIMRNDTTGDLKIIDYEYASMNDPYYDLALCNLGGTDAMDVELIKIYNGGEFDEDGFARLKLFKLVGDIKWTYWSLYQSLNSNVNFDYMNWYGTKVARLQYMWQDPRVDSWLNRLNGKPVFRS